MKRMAIGSVVGLVVLYVLGIVIWEMMFADFFAANAGSAEGVNREQPLIWAIVLGSLLYAVAITRNVVRDDAASLAGGLQAGAIVGLLLWGTADFILFGYWNVNTLTGTIADVVLEGVRGGITGAVVGLVLSKIGD